MTDDSKEEVVPEVVDAMLATEEEVGLGRITKK